MIETAKIVLNWLSENDIKVELLNLGGGFGIKYVEGDVSFPIEEGIAEITDAIKAETERLNYEVPEMVLNQAVLLLEKLELLYTK